MKYLCHNYSAFCLKQLFYLLVFSPVIWLTGCNSPQTTAANQPNTTTSAELVTSKNLNTPTAVITDEIKEPSGILTLRNALSLTLLHNPQLKAYSFEVRAAQARRLQSGLRENPELSIEVEDFGGSGDMSGLDGAETTIQLSQLIETGNRIEKKQRVSSLDARLSQFDYQAKKLDISTSLARTFIELLFMQDKQKLSGNLIEVSETIMDSVNKRVQAGKDSPVELSKAKIGLAKAKLQHAEITRQVQSIRRQLASYWSSRNPQFKEADGRLDNIKAIPELESLEELIRKNPDIARWAVEIQKRNAELQLAKTDAIPNFTLGGGVKHFNENDDTAFIFGLSLPLPVANRGQGNRREAIHNLNKARHSSQAALESMWSELYRVHGLLDTAHMKAVVLKDDILKDSEDVFNASKTSYEQGKIDFLTLLDAQRTFFAAKDELIDVLAEYHVFKTELERLIGQNLESIE